MSGGDCCRRSTVTVSPLTGFPLVRIGRIGAASLLALSGPPVPFTAVACNTVDKPGFITVVVGVAQAVTRWRRIGAARLLALSGPPVPFTAVACNTVDKPG